MLYLAGIFLSFFLSLLLVSKKNKLHADLVLLAWLLMIGVHLLDHYAYTSGFYVQFPALITIGFALPLLHGPFLFIYTKLQTTSGKFKTVYLLHFVPVIISLLLFSEFYGMSKTEQLGVVETRGVDFRVQRLINFVLIAASGVSYIVLSLLHLLRYRKNLVNQFSNTEKINFNWLLYLILWMIVIWIAVLLIGGDQIIFGTVSGFILWLGYFGIRQVPVFNQHHQKEKYVVDLTELNKELNAVPVEEAQTEGIAAIQTSKYQKSTLSDESANEIHARLLMLMDVEKPFTNPDLTLDELAKNLNVHPNHLSQVINSKEKKTFYDLINERRATEFIRVMSENSSSQFTMLGIALDCGFNSKASFNRNFKKYTGLAPRDYLKQQKAGN